MVSTQVHDEVDASSDHPSHDMRRKVSVGRHCKHLKAVQRRLRVARMQRGQAAIVSAGHRMDHVERLCPSDLADDDPLGTLTQSGALKYILHVDSAGALNVRVALFEAEELRTQLVQPEFGLCLADAGALALWVPQRQNSSQVRLA